MAPSGVQWTSDKIESLVRDLDELKASLKSNSGPEDIAHLKKMNRWSRLTSLLGYLLSAIPNPISIALMGTGNVSRWAMMAHHILHRGYDKVPGIPDRFTSKVFAQGWKRYFDWFDWMKPEAWQHEHNVLHHYNLGEKEDPDQVENLLKFMDTQSWSSPKRFTFFCFFMMTWKFSYYAPNTWIHLQRAKLRRENKEDNPAISLGQASTWLPWKFPGMQIWTQCFLPYILFKFILLPLPFLIFGKWAYLGSLSTILLAELWANVHSFLIIVPNHTGDDLYRFDTPSKSKGEFYIRQIVGSTNYHLGNNRVDFMHGWLNYQIEHHLWPDMTMLQYCKAQPKVKLICEKYGLPYTQESVFKRFNKLFDIAMGKRNMPIWENTHSPALSTELQHTPD